MTGCAGGRIALGMVLFLSGPVMPSDGRPVDPAVHAVIRGALHGGAEREIDAGIRALRRLRDPLLRPLFSAMVDSEDRARRKHGVLGLAELENPPRLNPLILAKIADSAERASILGSAMDAGLVGPGQVQDLLLLPDLEPFLETVLRCRLARETGIIDVERSAALATSDSLPVRVLASVLLAQEGRPAHLSAATDRLAEMEEPARGMIVGSLLEVIGRERLSGASPLLARLEGIYGSDAGLHADVLRVWLRVAPGDAAKAWARAFESAEDAADRLRYAMAALDSAETLDARLFEPMTRADEPVLTAMGRVGAALASASGFEEAIEAMLTLRYRPAELWLGARARDWPAERAAIARRMLITAAGRRQRVSEPVSDAVPEAAEALTRTAPAFLTEALRSACDRRDAHLALAILVGMLRSTEPAPPLPEDALSWPDRRCEAVALLVRARGMDPSELPADVVDGLEAVAADRASRLPLEVRVQSAWLVMRAQGEAEAVLARLLAGGT